MASTVMANARRSAGPCGGFTTGKPRLPMGNDIAERNVECFKVDKRS